MCLMIIGFSIGGAPEPSISHPGRIVVSFLLHRILSSDYCLPLPVILSRHLVASPPMAKTEALTKAVVFHLPPETGEAC